MKRKLRTGQGYQLPNIENTYRTNAKEGSPYLYTREHDDLDAFMILGTPNPNEETVKPHLKGSMSQQQIQPFNIQQINSTKMPDNSDVQSRYLQDMNDYVHKSRKMNEDLRREKRRLQLRGNDDPKSEKPSMFLKRKQTHDHSVLTPVNIRKAARNESHVTPYSNP